MPINPVYDDGPTCECGHQRYDHDLECVVKGCGCASFEKQVPIDRMDGWKDREDR